MSIPPDPPTVHAWSELSSDPIDEASVRARYAGGLHHVTTTRYPAGARFSGTARARECYVLSGRGRYTFDERSVELGPAEFVTLPSGDFRFEVVGPEPAIVVRVWKLPGGVSDDVA